MSTNKLAEDTEEVKKKSLSFMSEELSKVVRQQMGLEDLMEEVKQLKAVIKEKDKKIEELERRVDDGAATRMNNLMISELEATHCPYAQITAGDKEGEDAPRGELHTLEQQVINFFNSRDIPEDSQTVAACYVKPRSRVNKSNRSMIVIRFVSRKHKN